MSIDVSTTLDDELPFEPESFGVICAYNILHLVPDMEGTLAKIFSLLKPGGTFISSTACLGEGYVPYRVIISVMRLFGKAPNVVTILSKDELLAQIRDAGFESLTRPDVGAASTTGFVVASKPMSQSAAA